jgi:gamma-glutamylcyclotransferase (GGCT)/AIG2-like uncharacterized protein YtfP
MIRYFAYGHNTNVEEFARRIPPAILVGKACLPNYRLVMREFADVVPKKNEKVWGVLWDVPAGWVSELDELEADYAEKKVFVHWNGGRVKAMIYVMDNFHEGPPTAEYVNYLIEGYIENKLPLGQLKRAL